MYHSLKQNPNFPDKDRLEEGSTGVGRGIAFFGDETSIGSIGNQYYATPILAKSAVVPNGQILCDNTLTKTVFPDVPRWYREASKTER